MKKVIIIEDYQVLLDSYAKIINTSTQFKVVGKYTNCEDAILNIEEIDPDYVLIDITLPGMNGIEGISKIKSILHNVNIIVVSVHENSKYVFRALCAGAIGYVTKSSGEKKLLEALSQAEQGGAPMSISIARMVVKSFQQVKFDNLTPKENEVLVLLSNGKSYASIADQLEVSTNTIKYHVKNIYEKLHVSSRNEIIDLIRQKQME